LCGKWGIIAKCQEIVEGSRWYVKSCETAAPTPQNAAEAIEIGRLGEDYAGRIVAFARTQLLACSTYDRCMRGCAAPQAIFERDLPAQSIAFNPDGKTLAVAGRDIIFLDLPSGEQQAVLKGHPNGTTCLAFSPDGALLASGGFDGVVRIGNLQTRRLAGKFEHPAPVRALAFSPDGATLAAISWGTGSEPKQVCLWTLATGEQRDSFPCTKEKNLAFSDGSWRSWQNLQSCRRVIWLNERRGLQPRWTVDRRPPQYSLDHRPMECRHRQSPAVLKGHAIGLWRGL
jgi:WD40 repeat protein